MTPITEDHVLSLMKGLEAREKRAMKRLSKAVAEPVSHSGQATARILSFDAVDVARSVRRLVPADVVPLARSRAQRASHKAMPGRFLCLVPNATA